MARWLQTKKLGEKWGKRRFPRRRSCTIWISGRWLFLLHSRPAFQLNVWKSIARNESLARLSTPPGAERESVAEAEDSGAGQRARVFAIGRANWRHYYNRRSTVVVRP